MRRTIAVITLALAPLAGCSQAPVSSTVGSGAGSSVLGSTVGVLLVVVRVGVGVVLDGAGATTWTVRAVRGRRARAPRGTDEDACCDVCAARTDRVHAFAIQ